MCGLNLKEAKLSRKKKKGLLIASPAKTAVSPRSSPPGIVSRERLRLSSRNSILMTQSNVYIKKPVVMGLQMQICSILRFSWSILVSVVFIYERAPTKLKCFS